MTPAWMSELTHKSYDALSRVFSFECGGAQWVCATDGHMAIAIQSDAEAPELDHPLVGFIRECISMPTLCFTTMSELERIKPSMEPRTCEKCSGTGKRNCSACRGTGNVDGECRDCGSDRIVCEECNDGKKPCAHCREGKLAPEPHYVRIDGTVFNAQLFWRMLKHLTGDVVRAHVGNDRQLILRTDDWCLVTMFTSGCFADSIVTEFALEVAS